MMRKVGARGPPHVCTRPPSAGRLQAFNVPKRRTVGGFPPPPRQSEPGPTIRRRVRQSSAPLRYPALQEIRGKRPILEQPPFRIQTPTKPAPIARNFREARGRVPATFRMAQALFTRGLPWRVQNLVCLENRPTMISFSALCISGCTADMGIPVTTSERVGRTMEVKRFGRRRHTHDEQ